MNIELSHSSEQATAELLDMLILHRPANRQAPLSVQFLCSHKTEDDSIPQTNRMSLPPLSWFDANLLQEFTKQLAASTRLDSCQVELPDSGLRLTGTTRRDRAFKTNGQTIRVEALPTAARQFAPFSLNGTQADIRMYARKLYNRLWEVFCRG
jgi:hypothetical protein